jgi:hypothetical protein
LPVRRDEQPNRGRAHAATLPAPSRGWTPCEAPVPAKWKARFNLNERPRVAALDVGHAGSARGFDLRCRAQSHAGDSAAALRTSGQLGAALHPHQELAGRGELERRRVGHALGVGAALEIGVQRRRHQNLVQVQGRADLAQARILEIAPPAGRDHRLEHGPVVGQHRRDSSTFGTRRGDRVAVIEFMYIGKRSMWLATLRVV